MSLRRRLMLRSPQRLQAWSRERPLRPMGRTSPTSMAPSSSLERSRVMLWIVGRRRSWRCGDSRQVVTDGTNAGFAVDANGNATRILSAVSTATSYNDTNAVGAVVLRRNGADTAVQLFMGATSAIGWPDEAGNYGGMIISAMNNHTGHSPHELIVASDQRIALLPGMNGGGFMQMGRADPAHDFVFFGIDNAPWKGSGCEWGL